MNQRRTRTFSIRFVARALPAIIVCALAPVEAAPIGANASMVVGSPLRVAPVQNHEAVTHVSLDPAIYASIKQARQVTLTGFALTPTLSVDLELHAVDVFAADARIVAGSPGGDVPLAKPDVAIFSGHVKNQPGSFVFLALSPLGSNGLIEVGGETYVVSSHLNRNATDVVVYNLTALPPGTIKWREWTCDIDKLPAGANGQAQPAPAGMKAATANGATASAVSRRVTLAIETDWEFTGWLFGGDTGASGVYAATLIAAASEIYSRNVDTALEIGFLRLWPNSADPWNQPDTPSQLNQFRSYWNSNETGTARHLAHFLSGRGLGGGIAYLGVICASGFDYGLSANLNGAFPYPLADNSPQNWDIMVFSHEVGHNFGAPHTHNMSPPIDNCASGDCSVTPNATIMSYCHLCPGGLANILLRFHDRIINERIVPYLTSGVSCDISVGPENCLASQRPSTDTLGSRNRYLTLVPGNAGQQTALRIQPTTLPAAYSYLEGTSFWVTEPQQLSEHSASILRENAPEFPWFWGASLACSEPAAHVADWSTYGTVHVRHPAIVPGGLYVVQAIDESCDVSTENDYSIPFALSTSRWGDVVRDCLDDPCGPSNGSVNVITDAVAVLRKFQNLSGAPSKTRSDLEPGVLDGKVNITDVSRVIGAFQGFPYPFAGPTPCP